jgi:hypothetical protein
MAKRSKEERDFNRFKQSEEREFKERRRLNPITLKSVMRESERYNSASEKLDYFCKMLGEEFPEEERAKANREISRQIWGLSKSYLLTPGSIVDAEMEKAKSDEGRLRHLLKKYIKKARVGGEYVTGGHSPHQLVEIKSYYDAAQKAALRLGDVQTVAKLHSERNKRNKDNTSHYFKELGDIYASAGVYGMAKEQYLKAREITNLQAKKKSATSNYVNVDAIDEIERLDRAIEENDSKMRNKTLERRVSLVITIAGLGAGIFFLSSNITGNAIADLSTNTTSFLGAGLFVVGLVAGFFWLKRREK